MLSDLPGLGPKRLKLLERLGVENLADLLLLEPRRYEDRTRVLTAAQAAAAGEGLIEATVVAHDFFPARNEQVLKIVLSDGSAPVALVCFGRPFLARTFPVGSELRVYGTFQYRHGEIQSSSFEAERATTPHRAILLPVYPLTEGLTQTVVRRAIAAALEDPQLPEKLAAFLGTLPPGLEREKDLLPLVDSVLALHQPTTRQQLERGRYRLIFQEFFTFQLDLTRRSLARRRGVRRERPAPQRSFAGEIRGALPFDLTPDQQQVLQEIVADLDQPWPMARLLQGDVGSGKTLVALLAAAHAAERRQQVALLVPTELLAHQHYRNLSALARPAGMAVAILTGRLRSAERRQTVEAIARGEVDLVVGTHALFSQDVPWRQLGMVIVDEQHRFGVTQRQQLLNHGAAPDLLMMSATPIPRSLALTAFGDSEISTIHTVPPGRQPVKTHLARIGNDERVYAFVRQQLDCGHQAYLVYPAIDAGGARDLRSAEAMLPELQQRLAPHTVGLAHSRRDEEERTSTMRRFEAGEIAALVATSVVEVGVDVPNATVMVVEHAELFGLAALHQLRGRVGRGSAQSWCILVYQEPLTVEGTERLKVLYNSTDGFIIAEEDLRIRGPGDLAGQQQSGYLQFRLADIRRDMEIMLHARDAVRAVLENQNHREER